MIIQATVKAGKNKDSIVKKDDSTFVICVVERPVKGKANKKVIQLLKNYFNIPKSHITIIKGEKSKIKIIEIQI